MSNLPLQVLPVIATQNGASPSRTATMLAKFMENVDVPSRFKLPGGEVITAGKGKPLFTATFHSSNFLLKGINELNVGRAYIEEKFDIEGDVTAFAGLRNHIKENYYTFLSRLGLNLEIFLSSFRNANKKAIAHHYSLSDDFFFSFTDKNYHFYSQCFFKNPKETLEQAAIHKMENTFSALKLKNGMRVLDIGGGWGGTTRYCVPRGVDVTTLTLAKNSQNYMKKLIKEKGWQQKAQVIFTDFLDYKPNAPYDAIVNHGVIEHIPYYQRFTAKVWECLRPGGRMYLDGSAAEIKYSHGDFGHNFIYPGPHSCMCLQDVVRELLFHGFEIKEVVNERKEYALTMKHWAERFEANRKKMIPMCGERMWRAFHLYLWGTHLALKENTVQAYRIVTEKSEVQGPRPSNWERLIHFVRERVSR